MPTAPPGPRLRRSAAHLRVAALEGARVAVQALRANSARTLLALLSVAVGVAVVVVVVGVMRALERSLLLDLQRAGPDSFVVTRFPAPGARCDPALPGCLWPRNPPLRLRELRGLDTLPGVADVVGALDGLVVATHRARTLPLVDVRAYSAGWLRVDPGTIADGRDFTTREARQGERVALVNAPLVEQLFAGADPLGRVVVLRGAAFRVVGVFADGFAAVGGPETPRAIIPLLAARRAFNDDLAALRLIVRPRDGAARDVALDAVVTTLRTVRRLRPGTPDSFGIQRNEQLLAARRRLTRALGGVLLGVSGVALVVGGFGVLAIMTMAVTQRTREIGIRRAVGATQRGIAWQFVCEAVTLTGAGGALGLGAGALLAAAVNRRFGLPADLPLDAAAAGLLVSVGTGLVFGIAPALRAARVAPLVALRHE